MARRTTDPAQGSTSLRSYCLSALLITVISSIGYGASQPASEGPSHAEDQPRVNIIPRHPPAPDNSKSDIRVDVNVVLIPVTVTDPLGTPVLGLHPESFQVLEDGVEQPVAHLITQDAPLSVGFVFDASKSMESKLDKSRAAIAEIMKTSMPGDEYSLVSFNDNPKLLGGFTKEPGDIQNALMSIQPMGWTALLDAIHLSVNHMKRAKNTRKALVVLSDGGDNNSRFNQHEIRELLRESDVTLYAIGILGRMVTAGAMKLLSNLAEETGGRLFAVHNVNQLPEAVAKLNAALRDQYMLAYYSTNRARDGKFRRVQVRLVPPPSSPSLHASWRSGYYAPY
jgi:Ca-activated chloride channel homolog